MDEMDDMETTFLGEQRRVRASSNKTVIKE